MSVEHIEELDTLNQGRLKNQCNLGSVECIS